ncbi:hypothetical protein J3F84DRAFT_366833 [Trichoderma pleuroticola]
MKWIISSCMLAVQFPIWKATTLAERVITKPLVSNMSCARPEYGPSDSSYRTCKDLGIHLSSVRFPKVAQLGPQAYTIRYSTSDTQYNQHNNVQAKRRNAKECFK